MAILARNVKALIRHLMVVPFVCFVGHADAYDLSPLENAIEALAATGDLATTVEQDLGNEALEDVSESWPNMAAAARRSFLSDHFDIVLVSLKGDDGSYSRTINVSLRDDLPLAISPEPNFSYCDQLEGMVEEAFGDPSVFLDRSIPITRTSEITSSATDNHHSVRNFESYGVESVCVATYFKAGDVLTMTFIAGIGLKEQSELSLLKPLVPISCQFEGQLLWDGNPVEGRANERFEFDFVLDENRNEILRSNNIKLADAQFTDAHVSWTWVTSDSSETDFRVNRYSGLATMEIHSTDQPITFRQSSGACEVQRDRRF
ncbi:hypothetical protein [Roseobacter sp. HKCCA0882]|uniref:hypothetical protein n=1 Tax=Roseobacter sp. HKCCA0882 TaxID=3120337 RepID=UPI0030EF02CD